MLKFETNVTNSEARLLIVGVGGGGGNAVNRMIEDGIESVEYVTANTDYQALHNSKAETKLQLGEKLTKGLGAGAKPEIGEKAAEESYEQIKEALAGANMVFITAGMGGGTGTGASPVIAKASRELGCLTVGVVTTPFEFEGRVKTEKAKAGIEELKKFVDTLIIIPNDKINEIAQKDLTLKEAFNKGNEILKNSVKGITDIIKAPGMINLDFADIKTVMENKGIAHIGFGVSKGENRAIESAKAAIQSPLLETTIKGAKFVLTNITASEESFSMEEFKQINEFIYEAVGREHNPDIIVGTTYCKDGNNDEMSTIVIATDLAQEREEMIAPSQGDILKDLDIDIDSPMPSETIRKTPQIQSISDTSEETIELKDIKKPFIAPQKEETKDSIAGQLNIPPWLIKKK